MRADDADGLVALIGAIFAEFPGCVLDLDGLDADLLAPTDALARSGGVWWVLPTDAVDGLHGPGIAATVGCGPVVEGTAELKRLYVTAEARGRGLGTQLVARVEQHAAARGAVRIELWSDTRFLDAHRLYTRCGYEPTGETRELHDPSDTTEYRFLKQLRG
ncbi:MAG: GNAT family N-acetyltransferase [Nitriliruptoraceae bacterium]|nr:GNAT family N-acetyltransferase [Nitriliruptoraceae bacterium]